MSKTDKTAIAIIVIPLVLLLLLVAYYIFKYQQRLNDMKSVLAQSKVADMSTLSSYGFVDPVFREIYTNDAFYFNLNYCCSQQQFAKSSRTFYKAGATTEYGQTYDGWTGSMPNYFPERLAQGFFGDAEVKVQGKPYVFKVVNDTRAKRTTIIIFPAGR